MQDPLEIKKYIDKIFTAEEPKLTQARENSRRRGLPNIQISSHMGRLLALLAYLSKARRVLEIGTLGGYSTIYLAKNLPKEAEIITMEIMPGHVQIARENIEAADLACNIAVLEGEASKHLDQMITQKTPPFDFVFIDADKKNYPNYIIKTLQLVRPGSIIVCDNLIPKRGELSQPKHLDENAAAIHHCNQILASHPNLETIVLPANIKNNGLVDAMSISIVKQRTL
ncbi:MAG: O-methyltransferase [Simkaniaceae bacterium]